MLCVLKTIFIVICHSEEWSNQLLAKNSVMIISRQNIPSDTSVQSIHWNEFSGFYNELCQTLQVSVVFVVVDSLDNNDANDGLLTT